MTIGIYQDLGGTVGSVVYENTFSSFVSDVPTPNSTDVVTVDVGNVALASGSYLLFMTNPDSLGVATFAAPGNGGFVFVEGEHRSADRRYLQPGARREYRRLDQRRYSRGLDLGDDVAGVRGARSGRTWLAAT